jgi:putative intracellular protease/amidase
MLTIGANLTRCREGLAISKSKLPRVCLLATEETSPSVLYGLYDVLSTAGAVYSELTSGNPGKKILDVRIVSATINPFRCFGGVMVEPHDTIEQLDKTDVAIVCDMYTPIDTPPRGRYEREIDWLKRVYAKGAILGSVCSGSLVLAEAGLLDGQETSGHWAYRELFRNQYPKVKYRMDSILRAAGEQEPDSDGWRRHFLAGPRAISYCPSLRTAGCDQNSQDPPIVGSLGRAVALCSDNAPRAANGRRSGRLPELDSRKL